MARPRYQNGWLKVRGKRRKMWVIRWREDVLQADGTVTRTQRAETIGPVRQITQQKARSILQQRLGTAALISRRPQATLSLADFVRVEWRPKAELDLRKSSVRYYSFQLDRHILPVMGSIQLCDLSRGAIEACLAELKRKGRATATIRGVRATLSTVLEKAVERQYLEKNPAHGIRIREADFKKERRCYSAAEVFKLAAALGEPCRTIVLLAVLTGMRIGEILALRWKRVDMLRGTIEVAESFSDGEFGPPKTRSSNRVLPMSSALRDALQIHRAGTSWSGADDLVFCTSKGTPLSSKNLYNRALAPACDGLKLPRVSWHSFRHTHATLLVESGESVKTAQSLLGHSDLETTLNVYAHAIPDSQRRAVERIGVLLSDALRSASASESGRVN
ncbi:MAG TPA: tyrosine-type recombinase/integrase [Candidatus Acidoferrales bacterium]|nr:tyrosine-type recombinase/integrase [Candidatus Acidoferrales bacterium]